LERQLTLRWSIGDWPRAIKMHLDGGFLPVTVSLAWVGCSVMLWRGSKKVGKGEAGVKFGGAFREPSIPNFSMTRNIF